MKLSNIFFLTLIFFTNSSFSKLSKWKNDYSIEMGNGVLKIKRHLNTNLLKNQPDEMIYSVSCSDHEWTEKLSFLPFLQVSHSSEKDFRHNLTLLDESVINKIFSPGEISLYGFLNEAYGHDKMATVELEILPFLEKHQSKIDSCKEQRLIQIKAREKSDEQEKQRQAQWEKSEESREKREIVINLIGVTIAIIAGLVLLFIMYKKLPKYIRRAKSKSQELSKKVSDNLSERKDKKYAQSLHKKAIESAVDEIVRQAVRNAMSQGLDPSEIEICPSCKGAGCDVCSSKGWIKN